MRATARIFWLLVWLGSLILAGSIGLAMTASRVGEHKSSTFGQAYSRFQASWGGPIGIVPPRFAVERTYTERVYNSVSKAYENKIRTQNIALIPKQIDLESDLEYGEQKQGLLRFNAFEARQTETYEIINDSGYDGVLLLTVNKPENANIVFDFVVSLDTDGVYRPAMGTATRLSGDFGQGDTVTIQVSYVTKGMDTFKYNLSSYQNNVIQNLTASLHLNTNRFEVYRFGLPHTIDTGRREATVEFAMTDFTTTQDLGVTFDSRQAYLDQIQSIMRYSPISLGLFLLAVFIYTQIQRVEFNIFHYLFIAAIDIFYFMFVSYLVRFIGIWTTFGLSTLLTAAMFWAYCPNVLGKRFALRVAAPYLFCLTVVFSLIFLMPIFRGILFVTLLFGMFMSIMIPVSRSDISQWPIVAGGPEEARE